MFSQNELVRVAAIHEAGHIVAAHLMGFSADYVTIYTNGDGNSKINYGDLTPVAVPLMSLGLGCDFELFLRKLNPEPLHELGKRLCFVLLAGGAAEVCCGSQNTKGHVAVVEISGPDKTRAEVISNYLGLDLQAEMQLVYTCMEDTQIMRAVTQLSRFITESSNLCLNRDAIDKALDQSGFTKFYEDA